MSNYSLFIVVNLQRVFTAFDAYSSGFFYIKSSIKKVWTNRSTAADFVLTKNRRKSSGDHNRCSKCLKEDVKSN